MSKVKHSQNNKLKLKLKLKFIVFITVEMAILSSCCNKNRNLGYRELIKVVVKANNFNIWGILHLF